jgi:antitoxin component of MazEF toxin-antitoxin module
VRRKLVRVGNGRGIVIDDAVLEIINAADAEEFEVTTNGRELTLTPVRGTAPDPARATATAPSTTETHQPVNCEDPKETLRALHVAQTRGFNQAHFRRIHHRGPRASIASHVAYCQGTGKFTSRTNAIVCQRLVRALDLRDRGESWDDAITTAIKEYPFPKQ